jgi:hypothetical protein
MREFIDRNGCHWTHGSGGLDETETMIASAGWLAGATADRA